MTVLRFLLLRIAQKELYVLEVQDLDKYIGQTALRNN